MCLVPMRRAGRSVAGVPAGQMEPVVWFVWFGRREVTRGGCAGRTIVFADTKNDTDETALELSQTISAKALHGDIAQSQREVTLRSFKEGNFNVLVATDVAARGLDISSAPPALPPVTHDCHVL